jgi:hypothetical protein
MTSPLGVLLRLSSTLALAAAMAGARAGVLTDYAQVQVQAFGHDAGTPLYQFSQTSAGDLDSTGLAGGDAFGFAGAGRARVSLRGGELLEVEVASTAPPPSGTGSAFATAWSRAIWRDAVAYGDPAVDTLRFRFELAGTLAVSDLTGGAFTPQVSRAYLVAFASGAGFDVPAGPPGVPAAGGSWSVLAEDLSSLFPTMNGHRTLVTSDWIAPALAPTGEPGFGYAFAGSFEVVSRRLTGESLPAGGVFPLVVGLDVVASNRGAPSAADFATLRLAAVIDGAGNPLPLASLQFESGLQPIPEPATWALLLPGLALLAWTAARRRR